MIYALKGCLNLVIFAENQASADCRYYEIIKGIEINEFIAYIIWICQVFWRMKNLRYVWSICNFKGIISLLFQTE